MSWRSIFLLLVFLPGHAVAQGPSAEANAADLAELYAEAVRTAVSRVARSLVQVRVIGDYRGLGRDASGAMTGVLLDRRWVVTSSFGLEHRPEVLIVTLPTGDARSASLVSIDHSRQTVLLRLADQATEPPPLLEPRSDAQPGETAIGVGAVYDVASPNVSVGILSATSRRLGRAVQTDAAASPANYGGLLIDLHGRVLGVLCPAGQPGEPEGGAEWYDSGIGFAIPLDDVIARLPQMQSGQDIYQGRAGVSLKPGHEFLQAPVVQRVLAGGPADEAGLEPGDVITAVDGVQVSTRKRFQIELGPRDAGDEVTLSILRDEQELSLRLKLVPPAELPSQPKEEKTLLERIKEHLPEPE